eukprot:GILK01009384.1.p1 GENE.GILK01009384.1~~GILK01009384.1.p1  ORF type:complete len:178 (+),score=16.56 GILK01009384.1:29-535(+)
MEALWSRPFHAQAQPTQHFNSTARENDIATIVPLRDEQSNNLDSAPYARVNHSPVQTTDITQNMWPVVAALAIAGAAISAKFLVQQYSKYKSKVAFRSFYEGGFEAKMSRREAALILGVRESAPRDKVMTAYKKLMQINHPDSGGSTLLASKVNEAKELLLGSKNTNL